MTNPFAPPQQQQQTAPPQQGGGPATNPFAPQQQAAPPPQQPPQQPAPAQQAPQGGVNPFAPQQPQQAAPGGQDEFGQPGTGGGDRISGDTWRSYVGALVLFQVKSWKTNVTTENGITDAALSHVHVIDVPGGPIYHENAMVFTPAVRDKLQDAADAGGGSVLGRLKLVHSKQGTRTYVDMDPHTPQDVETARQYLAWRASQSIQQPASQEEPPF